MGLVPTLAESNFRSFEFREWPSTCEIRETKSTVATKDKMYTVLYMWCDYQLNI